MYFRFGQRCWRFFSGHARLITWQVRQALSLWVLWGGGSLDGIYKEVWMTAIRSADHLSLTADCLDNIQICLTKLWKVHQITHKFSNCNIDFPYFLVTKLDFCLSECVQLTLFSLQSIMNKLLPKYCLPSLGSNSCNKQYCVKSLVNQKWKHHPLYS